MSDTLFCIVILFARGRGTIRRGGYLAPGGSLPPRAGAISAGGYCGSVGPGVRASGGADSRRDRCRVGAARHSLAFVYTGAADKDDE